jgi:putative transposase
MPGFRAEQPICGTIRSKVRRRTYLNQYIIRVLSKELHQLLTAGLYGRKMPRLCKPPSPFRYFNSSPEVIRLVVMMYVRFPLSLRNVEDLLFERGIDISHETVRLWWNRFGPMFAGDIRRQRVNRMRGFKHWRWHLDEMYVKLNGEMVYLWRAVDHEGEILESYVTKTRDKAAALTFMKKTLKRHGSPEAITTDGLRSYGAAMTELGNREKQEIGRWANNRCENSHLSFRRRERAMLRFRRMKSLQKFASVHANVHNHFALERHLVDRQTYKERRSAALAEWQILAS